MTNEMPGVTLNCDMGESFGIYKFGADERLMRIIDVANVACGFHGSDFNHMRRTIQLAKQADVAVGAHPSLPDLQGFGRREMVISRTELANCILYQIGALMAFLKAEHMELNHIKPHGALYVMVARNGEIAHAIADAADVYRVPIFGLPGTAHETIYRECGHDFVAEDLDYDDGGNLVITREHPSLDHAVHYGRIVSASGKEYPIRVETVCIRSDTPNSTEIATAVAQSLKGMNH
jgi:5-oxoprolinase (ATP-hydrolysing) subunit A